MCEEAFNAVSRIFANDSEYFGHGNPKSVQYQTSNVLIPPPPPPYVTTVQGKGQVFMPPTLKKLKGHIAHMGQYQLLSVLSDRLSPLNIDHSRNLPVEICGINYTEKYTNL